MGIPAGTLIWTSFRPLIRLIIGVSFGFGLAKADLFPQAAARGAGQIILNITIPCLMFSKIVPAFTADNVAALGPLALVAILYEVLGILLAWIIKQFFWVPHRFRYGILIAGGWSNWGDIPTAIVLSICAAPPFNATTDQNLAVAYVSVFILVFSISLFPLGFHNLIAWDYKGPDVEDDEIKLATAARRKAIFTGNWRAFISADQSTTHLHGDEEAAGAAQSPSDEKQGKMSSLENEKNEKNGLPEVAVASALPFTSAPPPLSSIRNGKHVAFSPASSELDHDHDHDHDYPNPSHAPTVTATAFSPGPSRIPSPEPAEQHKTVESSRDASQSASITPATKWTCIKPTLLSFLKGLLHPASSSVIFSLIIAFTPPLKALFAPSTYHLSPGPDGLPPLSVLIDTANFIGAASVPLGLICLGGALARLPVPRGREAWRKLPSGAILALAVGKELVLPVLSVLICEGLTSVGVIPKDDKVLRYVCMLFSTLPTANTQVYLTQVYSGTGDASVVSSFLIPQYAIMLFSMTGVTAYAVAALF